MGNQAIDKRQRRQRKSSTVNLVTLKVDREIWLERGRWLAEVDESSGALIQDIETHDAAMILTDLDDNEYLCVRLK